MMSAMKTRNGIMVTPAISRGATRYLIGLVLRVVRASICSVTGMVPISAANAAPKRPATISPASTWLEFSGDAEDDDVVNRAFG